MNSQQYQKNHYIYQVYVKLDTYIIYLFQLFAVNLDEELEAKKDMDYVKAPKIGNYEMLTNLD